MQKGNTSRKQICTSLFSCMWSRSCSGGGGGGGGVGRGSMVPGKLPVLGRPTILLIVGQGPTALA